MVIINYEMKNYHKSNFYRAFSFKFIPLFSTHFLKFYFNGNN